MRFSNIIQGAAYIGPYTEFGWIPTLAVIVVGIFLFWIIYKLILSKMRGPEKKQVSVNEKENENEAKVINIREPQMNKDGTVKIAPKEEDVEAEEVILTPMSGRLLLITEVPDPVFSERMVGDGFAMEPNKGEVYSPVSGQVMQIYSNKDALTIKTRAARDIILHIGINTSNLKGEGIIFEVKEGDTVEAGDRIGWIDLENVIPKVSSIISPVVFPNLKEHERVVVKQTGMVDAKMEGIIVIEEDEE